VATLTIYCETDDEAQARADKTLAASDHMGVEVWIGGRRLYRARKCDSSRGGGAS
jgi:hypothetical protein